MVPVSRLVAERIHSDVLERMTCDGRLLMDMVLFCSLAVLDPRVGHTMDVLSPFILVLCHSAWLFHGESCTRLDVVHSGRAWPSSPACTWHCSLHYIFLQALFPHSVTMLTMMDMVRQQKHDEAESLKKWKLPVQIVSPLIAFMILFLIAYAIRQRVQYLRMLDRDDWKINFFDIDFVLPKKRRRNPGTDEKADRSNVLNQ